MDKFRGGVWRFMFSCRLRMSETPVCYWRVGLGCVCCRLYLQVQNVLKVLQIVTRTFIYVLFCGFDVIGTDVMFGG